MSYNGQSDNDINESGTSCEALSPAGVPRSSSVDLVVNQLLLEESERSGLMKKTVVL